MGELKSNLSYALAYAAMGWAVLPLHHPTGVNQCSCGKPECDRPAKHPRWDGELLAHGALSASTDPVLIRKWWEKWPYANIGVATGAVSGIVAIDVDPRHGGDASLKGLYGSNGHTIVTARSRTGGGGWHDIFAYPDYGAQIRNKGGVGGLAGLDIRSDGGLIVVPPSRHATGKAYRWERTPIKVQPGNVPEWFRPILVGSPGRASEDAGHYDWDTVFDGIADGNRDNTLFRYACYLRNLNIGRRQVEFLVLQAAAKCPNPFPQAEALKKVDQAFKYQPAPESKVVGPDGHPISHLRVMEFSVWAKKNIRDDAWLIDGWVPRRSTGLVVGKSGSFKSYLTLHMLACIAGGKPFLGQYPVLNPGRVVLFQQEDSAMTTIKRMAAILGVGEVKDIAGGWEVPVPDPLGGNLLIEEEHLLSFENPMAMGEFEEYIGDTKPLAVVMDPLNSLASAKDFMAGAPERMRLLKRLRDRFSTTFIIVHHTSKGAGGAGWEQIWGSQFLVGWKEFGWHLQKVAGESAVVVARYSKDSAEPERIRIDLNIQETSLSFKTARVTSEQVVLFEGEGDRPKAKEARRSVRAALVKEFRVHGISSNILDERLGVDSAEDIEVEDDE